MVVEPGEKEVEVMSEARSEVVARLRELEFGAGSHENLSMLAHAITPRAYGWNAATCEQVRDELVEMLDGSSSSDALVRALEAECDALRAVVELDTKMIEKLRLGAV